MSIVDRDGIWFRSHHGLDIDGIGRESGLCASAILQGEPWVVTDASADPRILANPFGACAVGLRFNLGVHLTADDGCNLGTRCVMDKRDPDRHRRPRRHATRSGRHGGGRAGATPRRQTHVEMEQQLRRQADMFCVALQTSLLPPCLPTVPGATIGALFRPAGGATSTTCFP